MYMYLLACCLFVHVLYSFLVAIHLVIRQITATPITVQKGAGQVRGAAEEMGVAPEKCLVATVPVATVNCSDTTE